ncbi:MAG: TonB-dependent receptor [Candidatus Latescibacteria bacterium]|nr:TonB-dependent receptor [Candidatus Latescibacterota bacterium]
MIKFLLVLLIIVWCSTCFAQEQFTVSGYIQDASTGEKLVGASYYAVELKKGGMANDYGFYSLTLPVDTYTLRFSFIGYETMEMQLSVTQDIKQNVELATKSIVVDEVVVSGKTEDKNVTSTEMGTTQINPMDIKSVPILFGEQDIVKSIQLLPGVHEAGEGNSGFFVRGGSADQNLVLLDEAPVYNASHMMGFFSVFNSDALKDVKLIKGSAPPEFGGRLSSVMDIKMKEGNSKNYSMMGGLGLISSRFTFEGPIVKNRGSFIISGRRTYADMFLKLAKDKDTRNSTLYFYDLNMKGNYELSDNDHLFVSGYFGRDALGLKNEFGFDWGNATATFRWNHLFNDKLFLNSSLIYSDYDYKFDINDVESTIDISSAIRDVNLKEDFQYYIRSGNTLKFGANSIFHTFMPGDLSVSEASSFNSFKIPERYALESAPYIAHEYDITQKFKVNYGLRYSIFNVIGPATVYKFDEDGEVSETTKYKKNEFFKTYSGLEPRFSANYILSDVRSLKFSYARNNQYIHLLSNTSSGTPLDLWHPSSAIVKPETADIVSTGYFHNFRNNEYEMSVETYYKDMQRQVDYKSGADLLLNSYVESELVFGKGWSYGLEYFLKKNTGKLNGWVGYTLSRTQRKFNDIDNGDSYPVRHDRTHDLSIVGTYTKNEKWIFSANWVFHTGDAVTFPSGKYNVDGYTVNLYTERNGYRMPSYHRLDLGVTYTRTKTKRYESSWNLSLYNAYGRKNAYAIFFRENENNPNFTEAVRVSLFTFFPSLTYNFKY